MSISGVTDFTVDGKCSQCGQCCGDILPLRKDEVERIKRYVKNHNIKEYRHLANVGVDMTCPFRDDTLKKCTIYPVRPWICQQFLCNHTHEDIAKAKIDSMKFADIVFMRNTFFGCTQDVRYFNKLRKAILQAGKSDEE